MLKSRALLSASLAVCAALALTACAGGSPAGDSASSPADAQSAEYNDADVMFAQMMIPHHEQAVDMSDDLLGKSGVDPAVVDLATGIKAAQEPEITQLNAWLTEWNAEEDSMSESHDMGDMGGDTDGMMSDDDMMALQEATGPDASRLFLEQMTVHHEGAVEMAQVEIDEGKNTDAQALAENIVTTQTAEIEVMAELLSTL